MALRSTSSAQANSNTLTITLPAGAAVGDLCFFFANTAWPMNTFPSGWTTITFTSGSTWDHYAAYKVLVAGDISLGTASVTTTNTYQMNGGMACFIGSPVQRQIQDGSGSNPQVLTCTGAVLNTDTGVYWCSARNSGVAITITPGAGSATLQQQNNQSDAAYALYTQAMPGGVQANTFNTHATTPAYSIQIIVEVGGAGANMLQLTGMDAMSNRGQMKGGFNG